MQESWLAATEVVICSVNKVTPIHEQHKYMVAIDINILPTVLLNIAVHMPSVLVIVNYIRTFVLVLRAVWT